MSGVQPFQFEPTYPPGQEPIDLEEVSQVIQINEMQEEESAAPSEECEAMATEEECFCCQELAELNEKFDESGLFFF